MAQLEYDENGGTFTYFLILLYGLFLLILSYFLWPGLGKDNNKARIVCQCGPCCRKRTKLEAQSPFKRLKWFLRIIVLILLWAVLIYLIYWAMTQEREYIEWDPYEVLQLDREASKSEIRKQYRELSKQYHPDKETGDQDMFMKIAKAYEALTDEESRANWEKYGNPDGPQAATFGIALPAWIVDKQNSIWVLGLYVLVFMVGLPVVVGTWWYRSVKFGSTNVLIETSRLFTYLLSRAKTIPMKRLQMILATGRELTNKQQAGVLDRPSDDIHLNVLVKQLPSVKVDTREQPFNRASVAKARLLLHAYLERIEMQDPGLLQDQDCIVKYSPYLIGEMINVLCQLWQYSKMYANKRGGARKIHEPTADMFENIMRFCQMLVQAIELPYQQLRQIPHINQGMTRFFVVKKRRITSVEELAALTNNERRHVLRSLSDQEYQDVMVFLDGFPHVEMHVSTEVVDDEDTSIITAGSLTTVCVHLRRTGLLEHYNRSLEEALSNGDDKNAREEVHDNNDQDIDDEFGPETIGSRNTNRHDKRDQSSKGATPTTTTTKQVNKKKKGKGGFGKRPQIKKKKSVKSVETNKQQADTPDDQTKDNNDVENNNSDSDQEDNDPSSVDEDKEWKELQKSVKKDKEKENAITSHPVHAPYFPADKQELWWLYIIDRKRNTILLPPEKVAGLQKEKNVRLRLMAPDRGSYKYSVVLMSDSYLNLFLQQELKLQVHERKEVSGKEQWADLEKEEEEDDMIEESVTESEESDED